ncbi:MAG: hypothetical protein HYZ53_15490 [Planctomycetes bacterium]|nr:hypothetical protein [Planctomycetota bacterium]
MRRLLARRPPRGASQTEYIVIVSLVAIACVLVVTVFGRAITDLFKRSTAALNTGSVLAVTSEPGAVLNRTPVLGIGESGRVEPFTGTVVVVPSDTSRFDRLANGNGFTADELRQVRNAFYGLPPAYQNVPIASLNRHPGPHPGVAFFRSGDNTVNFSDSVFGAGLDALNQTIADRGGTLRYTPDRILFHEMSHALHHNDPALVQTFLDQSFADKETKRAELEGKLQTQRDLITALEADRDAGTITADEFRRRRNEVFAEESRLIESYGYPSRFPGDVHSFKNEREYFAITAELYKYDRPRFEQLVRSGTITADEAQWFADHNATFN